MTLMTLFRSRKRRRTNKTGFPSPKKKKKSDSSQNETNTKSSPESVKCKVDTKVTEKSPGPQKDNSVKDQKLNKVTPKKTVSKQLKMDRFITNDKSSKKTATGKIKSSSPSPATSISASRRSVAQKAKNYR